MGAASVAERWHEAEAVLGVQRPGGVQCSTVAAAGRCTGYFERLQRSRRGHAGQSGAVLATLAAGHLHGDPTLLTVLWAEPAVVVK